MKTSTIIISLLIILALAFITYAIIKDEEKTPEQKCIEKGANWFNDDCYNEYDYESAKKEDAEKKLSIADKCFLSGKTWVKNYCLSKEDYEIMKIISGGCERYDLIIDKFNEEKSKLGLGSKLIINNEVGTYPLFKIPTFEVINLIKVDDVNIDNCLFINNTELIYNQEQNIKILRYNQIKSEIINASIKCKEITGNWHYDNIINELEALNLNIINKDYYCDDELCLRKEGDVCEVSQR